MRGRDCFSTLSTGSNGLLRLGAIPLTRAADVLEHYGIEPTPVDRPPVGGAGGALLATLAEGGASADQLVRRTGLDPGMVAASLVELELAGLVGEEAGVYREVMRPG